MDRKMNGTLDQSEPHPVAQGASRWVLQLPQDELAKWQESFSSCAIAGNRTAEVCGETLNRLITGKPVSDRYVLGLAFFLLMGDYNRSRAK